MTSTSTTPTAPSLTTKQGTFLLPWIGHGLEILWLLAVFLVPLTFLSKDYAISEAQISYVEIPKVALLRLLAGSMAVLWALEWAIKSQRQDSSAPLTAFFDFAEKLRPSRVFSGLVEWLKVHPIRWFLLAAALFFGSTVISTILSGSFINSMWGEIPGQDGYSAYTIASYGVLFGVIATHLKSSAQMGRLVTAVVLMGVLVGLYGSLQHFGHDFFDLTESTGGGRGRVTIFMGNAIFAGAVLSMTVPFTLLAAAITSQNEKLFDWGPLSRIGQLSRDSVTTLFWSSLLAVQLLGLMFTFSRGPWSGAVLAMVVFLGLIVVSFGFKMLIRTGLTVGLAGILSVAFLHWQESVTIVNIGSWLGFVVALLGLGGTVFVLFIIQRFGRGIIILAAMGALVTIVGAAVIAPSALSGRGADSTSASEDGPSATTQVTQRITSIKTDVLGGFAGGRSTHWKVSWKLIKDRPWFAFDDLSLSWLRPVIGYGPDLFRYTYLLESPPGNFNSFPSEPDHAHNFFLHQTVEQGILGGFASLAIFTSAFGVVAYHLVRRRQLGSPVYRLLLFGLVAIIFGRFLEMMVGVARISDLTTLWVLFAFFAALVSFDDKPQEPAAPSPSTPPKNLGRRRRSRANDSSTARSFSASLLFRLAIVAWVAGGIGVVTWQKSINSVRASVAEGHAVAHFNNDNLDQSLEELDKAIKLAPGVPSYYNNRAKIYLVYLLQPDVSTEPVCGQESSDDQEYLVCLGINSLESNLESVNQQPFNYRARMSAGDSAFNLNQGDTALDLYAKGSSMVPYSWPIRETLADSLIRAGRYEEAIAHLEQSLQITGGANRSSRVNTLLGQALHELGRSDEAIEFLKIEFGARQNQESLKLINEVNADRGVRLDIEYFDTLIDQNPEDMVEIYLRGLAHFVRGELDEALIDIDESIKLGIDSVEVLATRGYIRLKAGYGAIDLHDLVDAPNREPTIPLLHAYRAEFEVNSGHYAEAFIYLENADILDPESGLANLIRGKFLMQLGLENFAKDVFENSRELDLPTAQDYVDRGVIHGFFGDYDLAFTDLDNAIQINPDQPQYYNARGMTYANMGNLESALTDFDTAILKDSSDSNYFLNRGVLFDILGQHDRSTADFETARSMGVTDLPHSEDKDTSYFAAYSDTTTRQEESWLWFDLQTEIETLKVIIAVSHGGWFWEGRRWELRQELEQRQNSLQIVGEARLRSQRWALAIGIFTELITLSPGTPEAHRYRGVAYLGLSRFDDAINDFSKAIELNSGDSANFLARGKAYAEISDFELALSDFNTAARLNPTSSGPYKERGYIAVQSENYPATFTDINRAIEISPLDHDAYVKRAEAYIGLGEDSFALKDLEQAISLAPELPEAYYIRGLMRLESNDYGRAIEDFNGAIALSGRHLDADPQHSLAFVARGRAHLLNGNPHLALSDWETLIEVAEANFLQDDWEVVRVDIKKMLFDARQLRGDAYTELDQPVKASQEYQAALEYK